MSRKLWAGFACVVATVACSASDESGGDRSGMPGGPGSGGPGAGGPGPGGGDLGLGDPTNGSGTGGAVDFDGCAGVSAAAENTRGPADIIIAIDQSSSMDEETQWVQAQLNGFSQQVAAAGVALRVILIVEAPGGPVGENPICVPPPLAGPNCSDRLPDFMPINFHVDSNDALDQILGAYPIYAPILRQEATKHVAVITDDEPQLVPATAFNTQFPGLDPAMLGSYLFHAVVPFDENCPFAAGPSDQYLWLVNERGGVASDLCLQDFQTVWDALTASVAASALLQCEWTMPPPPPGETFDPALVNVTYTGGGQQKSLGRIASSADCGSFRDAWFYDDAQNPSKVMVCPALCDEIRAGQGQQIDIVFGCGSVDAIPR